MLQVLACRSRAFVRIASAPLWERHGNVLVAQAFSTAKGEAATHSEPRQKILLFGGNGYVGQGIVAAALRAGVDVVSISRSGKPRTFYPPAFSKGQVEWHIGDIVDVSTWRHSLKDVVGVISCVGAFGSNEFMDQVNGDANISCIKESHKLGAARFVFISTVDNNLPSFVMEGYFKGKRRAEQVVLDLFPRTGIVLRPSFIFGTRLVNISDSSTIPLPLWVVGRPLEALFTTTPVKLLRKKIPGMQAILAPPISRDVLSRVAVAAATGRLDHTVTRTAPTSPDNNGNSKEKKSKQILSEEDMKEVDESLHLHTL